MSQLRVIVKGHLAGFSGPILTAEFTTLTVLRGDLGLNRYSLNEGVD